MRVSKPSVDRSKKESQRPAAFAKDGSTKMFKPQAADRTRPGRTGKNESPSSSSRFAKGGKTKFGPSYSQPAKRDVQARARLPLYPHRVASHTHPGSAGYLFILFRGLENT
jgi:hypothetical protein